VKHCKHPNCGKPLSRRLGESNGHFSRRVHCNEVCSKNNPLTHKAQSDHYTALREQEKRTCPECGKVYSRKKNESRSLFTGKQTCGHKCDAAKRKREYREEIKKQTKPCANPNCKKEFHRRMTGKQMETEEKFKVRKTCSPQCGRAVRTLNNSHTWEKKVRKPPKPKKKDPPPFLPPVSPLQRDIPDKPQETEREVWRPDSWGGSYKISV
jgi:hypothetical protein